MVAEVIKRNRYRIVSHKKLALTAISLSIIPLIFIFVYYVYNLPTEFFYFGAVFLCMFPVCYFFTRNHTKKSLRETNDLKENGLSAKARIRDLYEHKYAEGADCYSIVYEFTDQNLQKITVDVGKFDHKEIDGIEIGSEIDILYDAKEPKRNFWIKEVG